MTGDGPMPGYRRAWTTGARRLLLSLLGAAVAATSALPAQAAPSRAVLEPTQVRGVALNRVVGAPAPLYVGEGVPPEKVDWLVAAMTIAWQEAPQFTGLPHPTTAIPLYLF